MSTTLTQSGLESAGAPGNSALKPFVSVIMPVRNEQRFIARSLGAVLAQDYPADRMEVIVVDGQSTDATPAHIKKLQGTYSNLKLLNNPGGIVPTGMNVALAEAKGEIIVRVDGHCEVAPDYVSRCVDHLQKDSVDGVGGAIETIGETIRARAIAIAMSSKFGVGDSSFRTVRDRTMLVDSVPFPAYSRAAIERAGPYDEELVRNQDDEYNYRLRKRGGRLLLASDVHSRYYSRSTLRSLWRQYFQYGYWKVRVMQKHPRQMRRRQFVPATFVGALLLSAASSFWTRHGIAVFAALVIAYLAANLSATYKISRKQKQKCWRTVALIPLCYGLVHISYGAGFLVGLVRFCHRWKSSPEISMNRGYAAASTH